VTDDWAPEAGRGWRPGAAYGWPTEGGGCLPHPVARIQRQAAARVNASCIALRRQRRIGSLAITTSRETAGHPHKFQTDNARRRAGGALN